MSGSQSATALALSSAHRAHMRATRCNDSATVVPQFGQRLVRPPPLHFNDDGSLLEIVRQPAIACEGDRTENRKLAQLQFFAKHAQHGAALAVSLVQQRMQVAAVLDVFLGFIEQDRRLKLLNGAKQCWRRNAAGPLRTTCNFIQEAQHRCFAAALGRRSDGQARRDGELVHQPSVQHPQRDGVGRGVGQHGIGLHRRRQCCPPI